MEGSNNYRFFLSFSLHLLVASLFISSGASAARVVVHTSGRSTPATTTTTTKFIRTSCEATTYPRVCVASLSAYATTIQSSPREMAHAALSVTLAGARSASAALSKMSTLPAGPKVVAKPREKAAVRDCLEELSDSVDELRRSMGEMGSLSGGGRPDFEAKMNDIQTWVSAALTDEDTCMDGFEEVGAGSEVRRAVRGRVVNLAQLTSNALALINALAATAAP